jgi:adenylate cyclase
LINRKKEKFLTAYGYIPSFKAGLHFGDVTVGEIGDVKRDIAFHGDTMNTAARIRSECSILKRNLLVSDVLLQQLPVTSNFDSESMGRLRLKGREAEIELFSITVAA